MGLILSTPFYKFLYFLCGYLPMVAKMIYNRPVRYPEDIGQKGRELETAAL
jgi:hypothetical protein